MADLPARVGRWGFPLAVTYVPQKYDPRPPFVLTQVTLRPFNQFNWPVPLARQSAADLRTFINDTPFHLIGKDKLPARQQDWPLPREPRPAADLRTFINDLPFQLIGKDKLPVRQQIWPVPIAPDYSISLRSWIIQPQAPFPPYAAATYMPGRVVDWGTAPATDFPIGLRTWTEAAQQAPTVLVQPPFSQDDWPVPIATDYSVSLRSFLVGPSLPLLSAPVQPPFSQDDWPLPIAAVQPIRTWTQSPTIATPVVAPTFMPGRVSEWGMWQSVSFTPADFAENIVLQSTAVTVQYVFRAPSYSAQSASPRFETWTTSVNLALRAGPPPQRPFTQTDWPLPVAARQPDRTYQRSFPPELIGKDRLPIRQQSWPLTPGTEFVNALRSIGFRSPALDVIVPRPFRQTDWPLTPWQARAVDLRTFINKTPFQLIGKDRLPFRQQDWPVPRAHREFHTLRSIMQGRVIYGGEVPPIPPIPPLPPPEVIHSVRAHADAYYGVFFADEIKGRADFSRAKGRDDEEAAN